MIGALLSADFFHVFVMFEVTAISSIVLTAFRRGVRESVEAGIKYGIYSIFAILIYYLSVAYVYGLFGSLNMADIARKSTQAGLGAGNELLGDLNTVLPVILGLIIWSISIKAALTPQHFWLPDAHSYAPSSISALLSGIVVAIPLTILARMIYSAFVVQEHGIAYEEVSLILTSFALLSILTGSILMNTQSDIKRLIAYSTLTHMGLVALGLSISSRLSIAASVMHVANHALVKSALFLVAGIIIHELGSRNVGDYAGLLRRMPLTTVTFILGVLALIGVPPSSILWSKGLLIMSIVDRGGYYTYLLVPVILGVMLEAAAYLRVITVMISEVHHGVRGGDINEPRHAVLIPLALTTAAFLLGVFINNLLAVSYTSADNLLDWRSYVNEVLVHNKLIQGVVGS